MNGSLPTMWYSCIIDATPEFFRRHALLRLEYAQEIRCVLVAEIIGNLIQCFPRIGETTPGFDMQTALREFLR